MIRLIRYVADGLEIPTEVFISAAHVESVHTEIISVAREVTVTVVTMTTGKKWYVTDDLDMVVTRVREEVRR